MDISIIIVNYNTYDLTKNTINSVIETANDIDYEVILVDNASADGSIQKLEEDFCGYQNIKIIKNDTNLGFSKANNIGMRIATGDYILLLNSDTKLEVDCLQNAIEYIKKDEKIGALGAKVVLPSGKLDHACKRGFPTPKASLFYLLKLDILNPKKFGIYDALHIGEDEIGEVDSLMGAFMLMPKIVFDEVGFLDEDFFMYGEDIDLSYRIKQAGYKIIYYPKSKIIHYKGGSSKKRRRKIIYDFHNAMWIFYKKHYYKEYNFLITGFVFLGIWMKYLLEILRNSFKKG